MNISETINKSLLEIAQKGVKKTKSSKPKNKKKKKPEFSIEELDALLKEEKDEQARKHLLTQKKNKELALSLETMEKANDKLDEQIAKNLAQFTKKKKSSSSVDFGKINESLVKAKDSYSIHIENNQNNIIVGNSSIDGNFKNNKTGKNSISILLKDIRLLSLNEIFNYLQKPKMKFLLFKYKKLCHELMTHILNTHSAELPDLRNKSVRVTYFRQSARFLDYDGFIAAFKFFLDGIVEFGLLSDDNPNFIEDIKHYQTKKRKDEPVLIGIRIEEVEEDTKEKENFNPLTSWGFIKVSDEIFSFEDSNQPTTIKTKEFENTNSQIDIFEDI